MTPYNIGIIDDDDKSIKLLSFYLKEYFPAIEIKATAQTFNEGLSLINSENLDLIFIDIHLNDDLGYELLDIASMKSTEIIFISSYQKHAIKVFKYNPVDYLLKPFEIKALCASVNRAIEKIKSREVVNVPTDKNQEVIALPVGNVIQMIKVADIKYAESNGNLTTFYLNNATTVTANKNIGTYEELLEKQNVIRIHKKYMVNLLHVKTIHKTNGFYCELNDGTTLDVSRRKTRAFTKVVELEIKL